MLETERKNTLINLLWKEAYDNQINLQAMRNQDLMQACVADNFRDWSFWAARPGIQCRVASLRVAFLFLIVLQHAETNLSVRLEWKSRIDAKRSTIPIVLQVQHLLGEPQLAQRDGVQRDDEFRAAQHRHPRTRPR